MIVDRHHYQLSYRAVIATGSIRTLSLLFQLASNWIAAGVEILALLKRATVALLVVLDYSIAAVTLNFELQTVNKLSAYSIISTNTRNIRGKFKKSPIHRTCIKLQVVHV